MNPTNHILALLAFSTGLALTGCSTGGRPAPAQTAPTASALPPRYLDIPAFQSCLDAREVGNMRQWCQPAAKPDTCPADSWTALDALQGQDRVSDC